MIDSIKHGLFRRKFPARSASGAARILFPATQEDKFNAMTMDATQICDAIKAKPMSPLQSDLYIIYRCQSACASELAYRAGMDADQSLLACTDDEIHHLANHIAWFFDEIRHNEFHPVIVRKTNGRSNFLPLN